MARLQNLLLLGLSASLGAAAPSAHSHGARADETPAPAVQDALYDGSCFYPTPDPAFPDDLAAYTGRWYQVAGTPQIFTAGCRCIYAEYGLTENGTVSVQNVCQLPLGIRNEIQGEASPVDAAYGAKGTFQVRFPSVPGGGVSCPGPNYIVQSKYSLMYTPTCGCSGAPPGGREPRRKRQIGPR